IEAGPEALDQIGLEKQGLGLGSGGDELHRRGRLDGAGDAAGLVGEPGIALDALFQASRLADIEDGPLSVDHAINAWAGGEPLDEAGDYLRARGRSPGRNRLFGFGAHCSLRLSTPLPSAKQ